MTIVKINQKGTARVLDGTIGMTFIVNSFTDGLVGPVAHVRDYRCGHDSFRGFQTWSLAADEYEIVEE